MIEHKDIKRITMRLPFPPSVNNYWRKNPRGMYLTKSALDFKLFTIEVVGHRTEPIYKDEELKIGMYLSPPDNRRRDLDNFAGKAIFDSLMNAQVFTDDSQIKIIESKFVKPNGERGYCDITLENL